MAVTQTPRLKLPQWSAGADSPSRAGFNAAFATLDAKAALDDGAAGGATLPTGTDDLVDGRYAQTVEGAYRRLFRRASGTWQQVGGNTWRETLYERAPDGAAQTASARERSHPSLASPTAIERWDGSSIRGGRQAVGDVNNVLGAVHVGDTTSAVDLATLGRVYARTSAAGQRGFVASAAATDSGPLYSAREPGGSVPWLVDARGRMQAQAPTAFGSAALTDGVPLAAAPGGSDLAAADLYAAAAKPALRVFRATGEPTPIASFAQDKITLGRASWTGGRVDVLGPGLYVDGTFTATGLATLNGNLNVSGDLDVDDIDADLIDASAVSLTGAVTAHGGKFYSTTDSTGVSVMARPPVQYGGAAAAQSLRSPYVYRREWRGDLVIVRETQNVFSLDVLMPEDGWMLLNAEALILSELGASNALETHKGYLTFELWNSANTTRLATPGADHVYTTTTDDTSRQIAGYVDHQYQDLYTVRLTAGTYTIRTYYQGDSVLSGHLKRLRFTVQSVVLHSVKATTT